MQINTKMKIYKGFELIKYKPYNSRMYELYPYFTNDGSVGLFSPDADDIYHSTYGALTEAYEKFIIPADIKNFLQKNKKIKVLDICFGIGYNSKSLINEFLNFAYSDPIGSDNIKYTNKIDADNIKSKLFIHAIDTDKNLAFLSPFFICNKSNLKHSLNKSMLFKNEKISKLLSNTCSPIFKLRKEVNVLLLNKLYEHIEKEQEEILKTKKYAPFFDKDMWHLYRFYKSKTSKTTPLRSLLAFLHNIYYRHISTWNKMALNSLNLIDFDFKLSIEDARQAILKDQNKYNFIFLDAFTPTKCPCLWTVDFFKLLYEHLEDDGLILTYSNSALVRNAFLNAGFYVGKIYSESAKKFTGTVATKNKSLIKNELSEYDLGLIKTRAGIFYHDKDLTLDNEAIIAAHKIEVENSNLISSSRFIKDYKKNYQHLS